MEEKKAMAQKKKRKAWEIIVIILACVLPTLLLSGCGCVKGVVCKVCSCLQIVV